MTRRKSVIYTHDDNDDVNGNNVCSYHREKSIDFLDNSTHLFRKCSFDDFNLFIGYITQILFQSLLIISYFTKLITNSDAESHKLTLSCNWKNLQMKMSLL